MRNHNPCPEEAPVSGHQPLPAPAGRGNPPGPFSQAAPLAFGKAGGAETNNLLPSAGITQGTRPTGSLVTLRLAARAARSCWLPASPPRSLISLGFPPLLLFHPHTQSPTQTSLFLLSREARAGVFLAAPHHLSQSPHQQVRRPREVTHLGVWCPNTGERGLEPRACDSCRHARLFSFPFPALALVMNYWPFPFLKE